jgi:predicted glycosyltransferase
VSHYVFFSHDGFGLGHVRRNTLVAEALIAQDASARVSIVTGAGGCPQWSDSSRIRVISVPPLLKDRLGSYRNPGMAFEEALRQRGSAFHRVIVDDPPEAVVVDRHPYGTAGELQAGLADARALGASLVLGLRDILDEPSAVEEEFAGKGWDDVCDTYDEVLVYGSPLLCDHRAEYGLPVTPTYCGWVCPPVLSSPRNPRLVVITAGGGGDGDEVYELGLGLLGLETRLHGVLVLGPYAADVPPRRLDPLGDRVTVVRNAPGCATHLASAAGVVQMAGYNATVEALAAGLRPILVPRRDPRREQAIRAARLAALGLADVVDERAHPAEVAWLMDRRRRLEPGALERAGLRLDGARQAAGRILQLTAKAAA